MFHARIGFALNGGRGRAVRAVVGAGVAIGLLNCATLTAPERSEPVSAAAQVEPSAALPSPAAAGGEPGVALPPCPAARVLDVQLIAQEAACLLSRYVQIDTSNPPGNELAAARFLQAVLQQEGIEASIVEPAEGRANLFARLGASGSRAVALAHHMDVVPAVAGEWSVPPFSGLVRDGMLWGRGALDDKAGGVLSLLTMLMAKRLSVALPYDLVLLGLADEEAGGGLGARYLTSEHPELLADVEYVMNEGGGILLLDEGRVVYQVEVAQKAPLWLRLVAKGVAGHGAAPSTTATTARLVRALSRLADHSFPIEVLPQVQALFAQKADSLPEALRQDAHDLRSALEKPAFREAFLSDPHRAALVRNTLAITMLRGSDKENVVPGEASAVLDMRLLPGQDVPAVIAEVTRVIADPEVEVETLLSWTAHSSPSDTALFRAIEAQAQARDAGALVLANVIGGFTDCNAFRAHGIACYGFMPMRLAPHAFAGMHGRDERIALSTLGEAVVAWLELLRGMPAPVPGAAVGAALTSGAQGR